MASSDPEFSSDVNPVVKRPVPYVEEGELPSDAAMLNWIEKIGVSITSIMLLGVPYWEVSGCDPLTQRSIQLSTGLTLREAIENAMKGHP